jgi:4-hydroxythreonine-4-phosphate dehydrogenase
LADPDVLQDRAACLKLDIDLRRFNPDSTPHKHIPGTLTLQALQVDAPVIAGQLNIANADHVLESIKSATSGCLSGKYQAMVTGPVSKAIINQAGHDFSGHTEFIAELCDTSFPVMLLANNKMRIALVTTHLPLAKVSEHITSDRLEKIITISASEMTRRFGIAHPRLLVCGLNPHAGEQGHLGDEEIEIIAPVLNKLRESGHLLKGPVPADTAFTPEALKDIDLVIAMYHDQGLPVLKSHGFGDTVNITLGLPIIRTSVDHGTALDLVGTGKASSSSLSCAIHQAIRLANNEIRIQKVSELEAH